MMMYEPKCVQWKRLGAEQVQRQTEGLTVKEELDFWNNQTEALKAMLRAAQSKMPNKSIQPTPSPLRSAEAADA